MEVVLLEAPARRTILAGEAICAAWIAAIMTRI